TRCRHQSRELQAIVQTSNQYIDQKRLAFGLCAGQINWQSWSNNNFENIGHILLTGNNATLQLSWHEEIRKNGEVPLATSLHFLTDKFWFKLNKGFGTNTFPKIFDVITKAQLVLSSQLNKSVSSKFEELQKRFKDGKIDEKQAALTVVNLRNQAKKPEEIDKDNISFILDSLSADNLDKMVEEQEYFKHKAREFEQENVELRKEVNKISSLFEGQKIEQEKNNDVHLSEVIGIKNNLLSEKKRNLEHLKKIKSEIDKKIERRILLLYKVIPFFIAAIYYSLFVYCVIKFGWSVMEPVTNLLSVLPAIIYFIISLFLEKTFNPIHLIDKRREKMRSTKYIDNSFDLQSFNSLQNDIVNIQNELEEASR
ncbi:MAG: hypothetical protein HGA16_00340, partial [Candidatus Moranbacteria bacterium]|nr:hypothetical protein [Candidatus Moranbacteria bacterium]